MAVKIASAFKAHLTVLFPYRLIDHGLTEDLLKLKVKLVEDAVSRFQAIQKQITTHDTLSYDFQPEIGFAYDRITSYLKSNEPDMIIISQRQANAMNELNNTALQNLITTSKLPFVIIPVTQNARDSIS
jgi:hypothetical protein